MSGVWYLLALAVLLSVVALRHNNPRRVFLTDCDDRGGVSTVVNHSRSRFSFVCKDGGRFEGTVREVVR